MGGENKDHRGKRRWKSERCQIFDSSRDETVSGLMVVWGSSCECGMSRVGVRCEVRVSGDQAVSVG